ncbi:tetratricopeptide repeat protein [Persicimonas caeni]|uniref:Tetratricopeptide repeat protein n=1 Tax=Persicimonas caeni TaxID=2292766 RepID=A0A4Y6PM77_PERCE|nr:tetratricopeptide repeat protein [Persicimonas caeni]QDG49323.1 tetratricopeptide repeat protein [Persicimonas caeni]QED30544.1 tetratricopeptide repeat protein [Persicimonas caeni]
MTTRVYQLAAELGLGKFELIDAINSLELDISVDNAMSALTPDEVAQLKRALKMEAFDPKPALGAWRLQSLTREGSPVRTDQSHLVIEEQRLWPVRPSFAGYISKHSKHEYQIEWDDEVGRLTVSRDGEESHIGLIGVNDDELRIRWAKDTRKFPRSFKSGGNLAVYQRETNPATSEQLLAGALLPESWELTYRGIELCDEGEHEEALELFDRALEIDPQHAQACYQRGVAQAERGQFDAARADFERALAIDEHLLGARESYARCLEDLGRIGEAARAWLEVAREEAAGYFEATTGLASSSKPLDVNVSPETWTYCANAFVKAGEPDKAVEVLEEAAGALDAAREKLGELSDDEWAELAAMRERLGDSSG